MSRLLALLACLAVATPSRAAHNRVHRKVTLTKSAPLPNLLYWGGKVLSSVHLVPVFWGPNVDKTVQAKLPAFYQDFAGSAVFDWLSEYDTNIKSQSGKAGTGQHIGRGSGGAAVTITPSIKGSTVSDAQIQTELTAQIAAHKLPAPTANTLYMVHFPPKVTIKNGSGTSCRDFCAYHGTTRKEVYYGVLPDQGPGSGCEKGCGPGASQVETLTISASHEIVEAVTDPGVGLASKMGPPLAWYDPSKDSAGAERAEIGDICATQDGTLGGWTVQKEWSNSRRACIVKGSDAPVVPKSGAAANGSGKKKR